MDPIIYYFPVIAEPIVLNAAQFQYDRHASPKLLKYGYNSIQEQIDLTSITSIPEYVVGLKADFNGAMGKTVSKFLGIKKATSLMAELWEIVSLFGLTTNNQTVNTNAADEIKTVFDYGKADVKISNKNADLVIHVASDSALNMDENAIVQLLTDDLAALLDSQKRGANMVLQLSAIQTSIMAELIYFLNASYDQAYLYRPTVVSQLADTVYLILKGFRSNVKYPGATVKSDDIYLVTMGLDVPISVVNTIQCMNAVLMGSKYKTYQTIKSYLNTGVYQGATYEELRKQQDKNAEQWVEKFSATTAQMFDDAVKKSQCADQAKLYNLYN